MLIPLNSRMLNGLYDHWGMHLLMLKDNERMTAYHRAINALVAPGDVVIDIGTGSGILAFLAAKAGADRVYAIEKGPMITLARELSKANGFDRIVTFIEGDSRELEIPETGDVIVSELMGVFAVDENMLDILVDARKRFLKPNGHMVPSRIDLCLVAIESPKAFGQLSLDSDDLFGLDFSHTNIFSAEYLFATELHRPDVRFLSGGTLLSSIDIYSVATPTFSHRCVIQITEHGTFHGLGGYWDALLFDGTVLSTDPVSRPNQTHWLNVFFPAKRPLQVNLGDTVVFQLCSELHGGEIKWSYKIESKAC
jgi:ubiquinone/menaquinone biosynthesis C-methylase UbiE